MTTKEDKKVTKTRTKKRVHGIYIVILVMVICLAFFCMSLPKIVEHYVVPELAKVLNVNLCDLSIRQISYGIIDLADVTIATKDNDKRLYLSSVRLDYTLSTKGVNITKVVVSGVELDAELTENNTLEIAGRDLAEWLSTINQKKSTTTNSTPKIDSSASWLTVDKISLEYSQINLKLVDGEWIVPVQVAISMPNEESNDIKVDFKATHGRDFIDGKLSLDYLAKTGDVLLSSRLSISRYLSMVKPDLDLPINGQLSCLLELNFSLADLTYSGKIDIDKQTISYDNMAELELPSQLEFCGNDSSVELIIKDSKLSYNDNFKLDIPQLSTQVEWRPELKVSGEFDSGFNVPTLSGALSSNFLLESSPQLKVIADYQINLADTTPNETLTGEIIYATNEAKLTLNSSDLCQLPYQSNSGTLYFNQPTFELNTTKLSQGWQVEARGAVKHFSANVFGRKFAGDELAFSAQTSPENSDLVALADLMVSNVTVSDIPVTLHHAKLSIPWNNLAEAKNPQRYEWEIITDKMLALHGGVTLADGGYIFDGDMTSSLFVDNPTFTTSLILQPNLQISANVEVADQALNLEQVKYFVPALQAWDIAGLVGCSLNYKYGLGNNSGDATIRIKHFDVENSELNLSANGINAEIDLPYLPRLFTGERVNIYCDSVNFKEFIFSNILVGFQISDNTLAIDEAGVDWLGGRIYTYALRLHRGLESVETTVFCDNLSLSQFINTFGLGYAEGEGRIYGRIPVVLGQDGIFFKPGYLYSEPGVSDTIRIGNMVIPENSGVAELDIATEAMKSFTYQWAKINFNSNEEGEVVVASIFDGKPTDKLPFTVDATTGQLSRVDYQGADFQGINLTLRWKVPLNELIKLKNIYNLTKGKL